MPAWPGDMASSFAGGALGNPGLRLRPGRRSSGGRLSPQAFPLHRLFYLEAAIRSERGDVDPRIRSQLLKEYNDVPIRGHFIEEGHGRKESLGVRQRTHKLGKGASLESVLPQRRRVKAELPT